MIRLLLSTFLVLTISLNVSAESFDSLISSEHSTCSSSLEKTIDYNIPILTVADECQNCDDCHSKDGHCEHHCSGLHNVLAGEEVSYIDVSAVDNFESSSWLYANHYKNPYLESSIIPPTFS